MLSVTAGEDKPLKYPYMFHHAAVLIINKMDLADVVEFDEQSCIHHAKQINPQLKIFKCSDKTGIGLNDWCDWIGNLKNNISREVLKPKCYSQQILPMPTNQIV